MYSPLTYHPGYPYCSDRNGIEITMLRFVLLSHVTIILNVYKDHLHLL